MHERLFEDSDIESKNMNPVSKPNENRVSLASKHFADRGHSVKDMHFSALK